MRHVSYIAVIMNPTDTQQKIIDAAIVIFNEDFSAPLEKVAEKAAVTRRTLHRYFKDRNDLVTLCERDMQVKCRKSMAEAMNSSTVPLVQLENMLYAGINCGAKYSFFNKIHSRHEHQHNAENKACAEYDAMYENYKNIIFLLQENGQISRHLTVEWILTLFSSVINAAVEAESIGSIARNSVKKFAWYSFSKGIGI